MEEEDEAVTKCFSLYDARVRKYVNETSSSKFMLAAMQDIELYSECLHVSILCFVENIDTTVWMNIVNNCSNNSMNIRSGYRLFS